MGDPFYLQPAFLWPLVGLFAAMAATCAITRLLGKRRDASFRRRETQLRTALDNAPEALMILDLEAGHFTVMNERTSELYGYPVEELLLMTPWDLSPATQPDGRPSKGAAEEIIMAASRGGRPVFEWTHENAAGEPILCEVRLVRIPGTNGNLICGSVVDIGERKRREEAKRESERRYRSLFEGSRDAIFVARADGTIEDINPAAVRLLGFDSKEQLLGVRATGLYRDPADRQVLIEKLARDGFVEEHETLLKTRQGEQLTVLETATAERDEEGRVERIQGILRDVTAQRELKRGLERTQRMEAIGRLAGGVAHDFNNLLTAISGYTELGLASIDEASPLHEHLRQIRSAGEHAATLTTQLLALSRQQVLEPRVLDLTTLVTDFKKLLRRTIDENVVIETVLEPEPWRVRADPGQLEQVLMNLAVNARDAMPGGGQLRIKTANVELDGTEIGRNVVVEPGAYILLSVTDTGCGMDAQTQNRVFEPFFTTKDEGKGTGLGLATVYGIVKQSGGYISIYSEPGEGTSVKIYLPRVLAALETPTPRPRAEPTTREPKTILLAEDNSMVRQLVARVLDGLGHRVLMAESPTEALRISAEHPEPLDLLLTDLVMPEMSGLQLAERISAERLETRVLVMSGYSKEARFSNDPRATGAAFIQKPFTPEDLERQVAQTLEQPVPTQKTGSARS